MAHRPLSALRFLHERFQNVGLLQILIMELCLELRFLIKKLNLIFQTTGRSKLRY